MSTQELPAALGVANEIDEVLDGSEAGGRVIRGGVLRTVTYALMTGLSVISAAVLTNHLGVARFGEYTTVLSLVGVVAAFTDAGMSSLGTREFAVREGRDRDELMRELLGLRVALTAIGIVLVAIFAAAAGYERALLLGAIAASLGTIALVVQHTLTIPLTSALRLGAISGLELARQVLSVVALVLLVGAGAGIFPLLTVVLAVNLALIPPTAMLARGQISLRMRFHPRRWLELLRLTLSFSLAAAVGTLYVYAAQILTSLVASRYQSGLFATSFRVFIVAAGIPGLVVGGALPLLARAARDDRERLAYALARMFEVSLIAGVGATITTLAGARFVIDLIANHSYAGAIVVLQIQGVAMIASFLIAVWCFALISMHLHRRLLIVNGIAFAISCAATIVLADVDGAVGASIASVCGESVLALGALVAMRRGHPELRPPVAVVLKVLLAALPATLLALLVEVPSLVLTILAVAVYGGVILATRAVPEEIVELLPRRSRGT